MTEIFAHVFIVTIVSNVFFLSKRLNKLIMFNEFLEILSVSNTVFVFFVLADN